MSLIVFFFSACSRCLGRFWPVGSLGGGASTPPLVCRARRRRLLLFLFPSPPTPPACLSAPPSPLVPTFFLPRQQCPPSSPPFPLPPTAAPTLPASSSPLGAARVHTVRVGLLEQRCSGRGRQSSLSDPGAAAAAASTTASASSCCVRFVGVGFYRE